MCGCECANRGRMIFFYGWCMINEFRANDLIVWMGSLMESGSADKERQQMFESCSVLKMDRVLG